MTVLDVLAANCGSAEERPSKAIPLVTHPFEVSVEFLDP